MTQAIFIPGEPAPQGSKRHVGNGVLIESSKKVGPWRERVALAVSEVVEGDPVRVPMVIDMNFIFSRPKSHLRADGTPRASAPDFPGRPDIDKLVRAVLDAITGIVFVDDSQVVLLYAAKHYDDRPGLFLSWRPRRLITNQEGPCDEVSRGRVRSG